MTTIEEHGITSEPAISRPLTAGSDALADLLAYIDAEVVQRDAADRHPFAEFEVLRRSGLGALRIPVADGGGGATLTELFETVVALGEVDPNVAHSLRNHFHFVESLLRSTGEPEQRWRQRVVEGALFGTSTSERTTTQAGSRNRAFATTVSRAPDGLRLNGSKIYSTGNLYATYLVVSAAGPDGQPVRVVVPSDRDGVAVPQDWDGIGQRFTGSGTTEFGDVVIDESEFLSRGTQYGELTYSATFPQLYLTAVVAGILRRVVRDAAELVRTKHRTFYHAAAENPVDDPILQQTVGLLASQAFAAEALVGTAAAALSDAYATFGTPAEPELSTRAALRAAKAKVVVDELALRAAGDLFDVGGGTAARRSSHLDRHWRNIRTLASHNPKTYKAKAIGAYEISGRPLPDGAFF